MSFMTIIQQFAGPVIEYFDHRNERAHRQRAQENELEDARHQRRMTNISEERSAEVDWNINAQNNSGWKDEWFTIILSIPMIMCFIPGLAVYVQAGFDALRETPMWYQSAVGIAISSSFGYQLYARHMMNRNRDGSRDQNTSPSDAT